MIMTIMIIIIIIIANNWNLYPRHMLGLAGDTGSEFVPGERKLKVQYHYHDCDCNCDDDCNHDNEDQDTYFDNCNTQA